MVTSERPYIDNIPTFEWGEFEALDVNEESSTQGREVGLLNGPGPIFQHSNGMPDSEACRSARFNAASGGFVHWCVLTIVHHHTPGAPGNS